MYPLCLCFRCCCTAWECLSMCCFPRLWGMINCVLLKGTKSMISRVVRGKKIVSDFPVLFSAPWSSSWYLLLGALFYLYLPSFYGEDFPRQEEDWRHWKCLRCEVQADFYKLFKIKLLLQHSPSLTALFSICQCAGTYLSKSLLQSSLVLPGCSFPYVSTSVQLDAKLVRHYAWLPTHIWFWR